jgi:hypothetical protein
VPVIECTSVEGKRQLLWSGTVPRSLDRSADPRTSRLLPPLPASPKSSFSRSDKTRRTTACNMKPCTDAMDMVCFSISYMYKGVRSRSMCLVTPTPVFPFIRVHLNSDLYPKQRGSSAIKSYEEPMATVRRLTSFCNNHPTRL